MDLIMEEKTEIQQEKPQFLKIGILVGILSAFVLFAILFYMRPSPEWRPVAGEIAPQFSVTSYTGEVYSSESLRGQIVILNFWANWCAPCHAEAPDFEQIYREYADDGVIILGMNWLDSDEAALSFIERYELSYPNAPDIDETVYNAFQVQGMPQSFVIGRDGRIVSVYLGAVTYDNLAEVLNDLIDEGA